MTELSLGHPGMLLQIHEDEPLETLGQPIPAGVTVLPLRDPSVTLRACIAFRRDSATWAPLGLVLDSLSA
ncbi:MAG: hypothetical protein AVDCRST_MAG32-2290 [uncultured Nocardioides sp.]|uniref:Uncharacterized protein n=1 Tax=uncultured Nocardioides sp. TaxID=198441 RepID=A0A6J4NMY2_9ACTN|nr:MAG: hypothetical protein AVDCRST_MAG32-2290 [uncultured Nocardioides sp.]